ncbi:MAG TPA: sigma-70 family RNA polymerase sigma factor [Gemmatimonas sp.]|nr:sigma-70 family RNA polymerase sigma factor [Gemmatimonas sp.]
MNDEALERLFKLYHTPLVRYLTRRLGDRDWAEEVAQETFLRALRQESITSERSWLFAVATNLVRDEARKDQRRRGRLQLLASEERAREELRVDDPGNGTEEYEEYDAKRALEMAMARKAVDALAERDRLALLMREEGLDYHEIADALGLSFGSVGTTLARARRRLTESYEKLQAGDTRAEGTSGAS